MKDPARLAISLIFISPVLAWSVVSFGGLALADTLVDEQPSTSQVATREERAESRAQKYNNKFTWSQLQQVRQNCESSTRSLSDIRLRLDNLRSGRAQSYVMASDRIEEVVEKLQAVGLSVTELSRHSVDFIILAADFQDTLLLYTAVLDDLVQPGCAERAEDFMGAIAEVRELRKALIEQEKIIKAHLKDAVEPELNAAVERLSSHSDETGVGHE